MFQPIKLNIHALLCIFSLVVIYLVENLFFDLKERFFILYFCFCQDAWDDDDDDETKESSQPTLATKKKKKKLADIIAEKEVSNN